PPPPPPSSAAPYTTPFRPHRNIPDLRPDPADPRPAWQQVADKLRAAIRSAELAPGDALPSVPELHEPHPPHSAPCGTRSSGTDGDRKSTRLNSSHGSNSYA